MSGALPNGWRIAELGSIAKLINGDRGKNYPSKEAFVTEGVPFVNAGHLIRGTIDLPSMNYITEDHYVRLGSGKIQRNDILYCLRGSLGKIALVGNIDRGAIASSLVIIRSTGEVRPEFLFSFLSSPWALSLIKKYDNGSAQPNLASNNVALYTVPVAPKHEQQRIVEALDSYLTRLDAATASLKRVEANLKRYRASVLKAAVEGRLVPTEAEVARKEGRDYEPASTLLARILKERRHRWEQTELARLRAKGTPPKDNTWKSKYQPPAEPNTEGLPNLPEGWCWAALDQLIESLRNGISTTPAEGGTVPVLRISAVRPMSLDLSKMRMLPGNESDYEGYELRLGDLLFTRYNGNVSLVGACAVVNSEVPSIRYPDKLIRIRLQSGLSSSFVALASSTGKGREHLNERTRTTAGQAGISGSDLRSMAIPLAPFLEQQRITDAVNASLDSERRIGDASEFTSARMSRLRQSILKWAFEGKLVDQDPTDEPASVLLDRIRQKENLPKQKPKTRKS
jgi:type I restriction enzyme, S subunit